MRQLFASFYGTVPANASPFVVECIAFYVGSIHKHRGEPRLPREQFKCDAVFQAYNNGFSFTSPPPKRG